MSSKSASNVGGDVSMIEEYFSILKKYREQYATTSGSVKIALLYQCGSFYELYGLKGSDANSSFIENPEIEDITNVCGLAFVAKKYTFRGKTVYMAGVRDYIIEKYLAILNEAGYTSIVYSQHREGAKFVRKLDSIVSRGTYITYETDTTAQHSNHIMCIWVERLKNQLLVGISTANIFTGKSYFFEYVTEYSMSPTNFDEIERQVASFHPNELIFVSNLSGGSGGGEIQDILKYSGVKCSLIHYIDLITNEKAINCTKQNYIKHVFATYFGGGADIVDTCMEFMTNLIATQSFCYLLNFIYEHNPNLLKNICLPVINNTSTRMILGNQTLRQLNLIDDGSLDGKRAGKFSSVLMFLNCTCTPMGRRAFSQQFVNPTFDEEWLENEYRMIDVALLWQEVETVREELNAMKDIEKMTRQIVLRKIYPCSIYNLYKSIEIIARIYEPMLSSVPEICGYATAAGNEHEFLPNCIELIEFFRKHFHLEKCKTVSSVSSFDENIFCAGNFQELDIVEQKYTDAVNTFYKIHAFLNKLVQQSEEGGAMSGGFAPSAAEFVKIHETEKSGCSLQITKRRALVLKGILGKQTSISDAEAQGIDISDIKFSGATNSCEEIHSRQIRELCQSLIVLKDKRNQLISAAYTQILETIERDKYFHIIQSICNFVAKLDVLLCKTHVARKYNYCRPIIKSDAEKSFVCARGIRHVLIEHLQTKEIYVPNDVSIGGGEAPAAAPAGMLIYGVNTTGKTSYIRSIGISIVMAQTGMFVPCAEFTYKPYTAIFSRILGNDNLFHGLSTFAVEMSELRVILKMSDRGTLVIGDEVCSGTETQSALSIFVTALLELLNKQCSFLFATHFHEILSYDEVRDPMMAGILKVCHMAVLYDRERDALVYERKLRDGAGYRMYGIEICKSLHLPDEFIEKAHCFRNKYFAETAGALSHKPSIYNSAKIRGMCEKCGERMSEETHHVFPQKSADPATGIISAAEDGMTFHKNHSGNLMGLCEKCHKEIHSPPGATQKRRIIKKKK